MNSRYLKVLILAVACLGGIGEGIASPFVANFSISGMSDESPIQSISGSVTYEASSLYGTIESITAINLNIGGHAYTVDEVGYLTFVTPPENAPFNWTLVGGKVNDVGGVGQYTTDFSLRWRTDTHEWIDFNYAVPDKNGVWGAAFWDPVSVQFSISAAPVPEPETYGMMLAGLCLMTGLASRRRGQS